MLRTYLPVLSAGIRTRLGRPLEAPQFRHELAGKRGDARQAFFSIDLNGACGVKFVFSR